MNGTNNPSLPEQQADPVQAGDFFEGFSESLFEIAWRRRWTILLTVVAALAGAIVYLQKATPLYKSTSRVYVEQSTPRIFRDSDEGMLSRSTNYLYTQAELLESAPILSAAMKTGRMEQLRSFQTASNIMGALRRGLDTVVGKKDELISVSFMSPYPEEAAHVVNTVVDAYVTFHGQRKRNTSGELLKILTEEKTKRDAELDTKLQAMMEFKQKSEGLALGTDQDNNVILRDFEQVQNALTQAHLATIESKSFYEATKKMENDPAGLRQFVEAQRSRNTYFSTASEISSLRAELKRLERDKADCLQQLKSDAPAISALDAEISQIEKQIADLDSDFARSHLAVAQQEYQAALAREEELAKSVEEKRQQAIVLNNQVSQYTLLQSEYEQTRKMCDLLDERIKELSVIEETGALNITVLETAEPALEPSEPQKPKAMAMALGLGLFAGVGLALLREWKDQRLRSAEEISALLALPVVGAVPTINVPRGEAGARGQRILTHPDSREAEAFRTLRTAVFFGVPKDEARTIVVTSPAPGEGKSTVVSNLAIAMAQAGQRVLLIDADFRRPTQHKIFNLDRLARGLSAVLAGQMPLEEAIERSGIANLDVLTCGPDVPNPAEIIGSQSFAEVVKRLSEDYDRILIDSPPVAAVTDPLILAALCDVTILVVRAEQSMRRVSMQARDSLASVEARILGVVVNDVPLKSGRYGYYGGYGYRYYGQYGNGKQKKSRPKTTVAVEAREIAVPLKEYRATRTKPEKAPTGTTNASITLSEFWKDVARDRRGRLEDDSSKQTSV
ncbi:MAG: polysaccharide biosynthesis tyrosine autokinase [Planctomycetes bacterium]|nr:polysaccharide biosynthesis tyrosine autokinase [Planctomycetota bacterium]